jgi:hypothetical protein
MHRALSLGASYQTGRSLVIPLIRVFRALPEKYPRLAEPLFRTSDADLTGHQDRIQLASCFRFYMIRKPKPPEISRL